MLEEVESKQAGAKYAAMWVTTGHSSDEYYHIMRVVAERAFIAAIAPSSTQIARWKVTGTTSRGLSAHIVATTGKVVTAETAKRLWRLFSNCPEPRRARTIADFLAGFPDRLKCQYCGDTQGPFHVDHCIPLRKGGPDALTNLQVLCEQCNLKKGSKLDPYRIYLEFEN